MNTDLIEKAYGHLTADLGLSRDRDYLVGDRPVALVAFDDDLAERTGVLSLRSIDVTRRGEGLGTRIVEALKVFADGSGTVLRVGPCINTRYWRSGDGKRPDRYPWLELVGEEDGSPVYEYQPSNGLAQSA